MLTRKPGLKYINRAEQTAYDFDQTGLTADNNWHTLSLSAIVPARAKLAVIRMRASNSSTSRTFRLSKVGFTNSFSVASLTTPVANIAVEQTTILDCTGQQIQYWLTSGTWAVVGIIVLGWFV
jgi:hypothetical protein